MTAHLTDKQIKEFTSYLLHIKLYNEMLEDLESVINHERNLNKDR